MQKLSQWAKKNSMSYSGAYNLFKQGRLPVKCVQLPSGTILVQDDSKTSCKVTDETTGRSFSVEVDLDINSCGLSGGDQKEILENIARLVDLIASKIGFSSNQKKMWVP